MTKPFYCDYVRHCLRFYTRNLSLNRFNTEVDKNNWYACHRVIKNYPEKDRDILIAIYSGYDTIGDNVYGASMANGINQNIVWDMMRDVERKIAKVRGLM